MRIIPVRRYLVILGLGLFVNQLIINKNVDEPFFELYATNDTHLGESVDTAQPVQKMPVIRDPNLKVELYASGLFQPTTMVFVGTDDILVLEKSNGTVRRDLNGQAMNL